MKNSPMSVYRPEGTQAVIEFYGSLLPDRLAFNSIRDHLKALADRLFEGWKKNDPRSLWEISNHHPEFISCKSDELFQSDFTRSDALRTIAGEYGYQDWADLQERGSIQYDPIFEQAIDRLLHGQIKDLSKLIDENPDLINQRSNYGHGAGLIHYCASNGVELWRQLVPFNLPEMIRYLLRNGAHADMKMYVYGGQYKPLDLLESSVHPVDAGVAEEAISCFAIS